MFLGYRKPIDKDKYFINLGCSHAAAWRMPIEESYPYLLAKKFNLGYLDFAWNRTSLEYSEYCLNYTDYNKAEFVLWQLTYPWRVHDFTADNKTDARLDNIKDITLKDSFSMFADILYKYRKNNVFFLFVHQEYAVAYMNQLISINSKLYPTNFKLIDKGFDDVHGGKETQKMIANEMYEFINQYDTTY